MGKIMKTRIIYVQFIQYVLVACGLIGMPTLAFSQSSEKSSIEANALQETSQKQHEKTIFKRRPLYILGGLGYAPGSTDENDIIQRALNLNPPLVLDPDVSVDDSRSGSEVGIGYWLTKNIALEFAYTDLGSVEVSGSTIINPADLDQFASLVTELHPDSGKGYSLSGLYDLQLGKKFSVFGRLGILWWRGSHQTFIDGQFISTDRESENELFIGLGGKYRLSNRFDAFAEVRDYDLARDDTQFFLLGLHYYFGKKHKIQLKQEPEKVEAIVATIPKLPVIQEPLDSDGDGVLDKDDLCPDTPPGYAVDETGCVVEQSVELLIEFPTDSAEVSRDYYVQIENVIKVMDDAPNIEIEIEGHTDNRGSSQYNLKLSERRAKAVKDIMVKKYSISANRVHSYGYGEDRPVSTNDTEEGRQRNRRVMATIIKK